jgi:hypothetical protein
MILYVIMLITIITAVIILIELRWLTGIVVLC